MKSIFLGALAPWPRFAQNTDFLVSTYELGRYTY
jgi:hypothetical protein